MTETRITPEWGKHLNNVEIDKRKTRVGKWPIFSSLQINLI